MNVLPYFYFYRFYKRGKKYVLCYGLYGARPECRKIQGVSAAHRGPRAGRPAGGGRSLRPDGLWAACHHGTDPGGDAALLPGR